MKFVIVFSRKWTQYLCFGLGKSVEKILYYGDGLKDEVSGMPLEALRDAEMFEEFN